MGNMDLSTSRLHPGNRYSQILCQSRKLDITQSSGRADTYNNDYDNEPIAWASPGWWYWWYSHWPGLMIFSTLRPPIDQKRCINGTLCIQEMSRKSTCPTFPTPKRLAQWNMHWNMQLLLLLRVDRYTSRVHVFNVTWKMPMHSLVASVLVYLLAVCYIVYYTVNREIDTTLALDIIWVYLLAVCR